MNEEDIKLLEEFINYKNKSNIHYHLIAISHERLCEAIKHLISRNKELEKEYKVLREYVNFAPNLDEISAIKYKEICQSAYIEGRRDEKNMAKEIIEENYILKSKVREIIYPTPTNPIDLEIQNSKMYKNIIKLIEREETND